MYTLHKHPYHLVQPSPWPLVVSVFSLYVTVTLALTFHEQGSIYLVVSSFSALVYTIIYWFKDVMQEASWFGQHTACVQNLLETGFILFILSEVVFFIAFFWAFFHCSLSPSVEIGGVWPPRGITPPSPWGVPLYNTTILLVSGATVTWAHHECIMGNKTASEEALLATIVLGSFFLITQLVEYVYLPFNIATSVYGSSFFMLTGFHGFHVLVGTVFLGFGLYRMISHQFNKQHHAGFEFAILYWHFVDIVWLGLFIMLYWWGGSGSHV